MQTLAHAFPGEWQKYYVPSYYKTSLVTHDWLGGEEIGLKTLYVRPDMGWGKRGEGGGQGGIGLASSQLGRGFQRLTA